MLAALFLSAVFTASYDADFRGDVGGETVPANFSGGVLWEDIEAHLKTGIAGRSLSIGTPETKASALYAVYPNRGFIRPEEGSISFWVMSVDWTGGDGRYHVFVRAEGPDANLLVYKTAANALAVYSSFRKTKESSCVAFPVRDWKPGAWHHVSVEWKDGLVRLFTDGALRTSGAFLKPGSDYERVGVGGLRPLDWKNPMNFSQIDELRISTAARDAVAVQADYAKLCDRAGASAAAGGLSAEEVRRAMTEPEPWRTEKLGCGTDCPKPWTPVVWDEATHTLRCWNRDYVFGESGLPERIVSAGCDLLTRPVAFELDGCGVSFGAPSVEAATPSEITVVASGRAGGFAARARTTVAFDGFAWTEIELKPSGAETFKSLVLTFPFRKEASTLFNAMKKQYMEFSPDHAGAFRAYRHDLFIQESRCMFVGDGAVGLEWFCEEMEDWYLKDHRRSLELVPGEDENRLVLNLADSPSEPGRTCRYRFGYQALPVRPLPANWRLARAFQGNPDGFVPYVDWSIHHNQPQPEAALTNLTEVLSFWGKYSPTVLWYLAGFTTTPYQRAWVRHGAEWNKTPPAAGTVGSANSPSSAFCWVCAAAPGWADYYVWNLAKLIDHFNIRGLYFDNQDPQFCDNAAHGCGFTGRDGRRYATYNLRATRALVEREYRLFREKCPEGKIMRHMSMKSVMATDSLCDFIVDGECYCGTLSRSESYVDVFRPDHFRAMYSTMPYGVPRYFIPQIERSIKLYGQDRKRYSTQEKSKAEHAKHLPAARHFLAYLVVHDCLLWHGGGVDEKPWYAILDRFGQDGTERFVRYDDPASPFGCANARVMASVYAKGDRLLAVVLNDTDAPLKGVRFDRAKLDALAPGAKLDLRNEETLAPVAVVGDEIAVTVPARDYVILGNF